jgi:peptidoglycan hydrolase CwlO-like protein
MKEILLQLLLAAGTSAIGFILGFRKSQAELESSKLDNLEKSIHVYNVIIEDLSKKVEELTAHVAKLEKQIADLMAENRKLKKQNTI